MEMFNEYILVEIPEEKSQIKTANSNSWREVVVVKSDDERFKVGDKLIAAHSSAVKFKDATYFIQTRHVFMKGA